jgi:ribosome-associated protein
MPGDRFRVSGSCVIGLDELEWRFSGSGGPGGQHANTANTRVEVRFDVEASRSLGPRQRARLLERLASRLDGSGRLRLVSAAHRSQLQNREAVTARLREVVAAALVVPKTRRPTKPSRAEKQRRLDEKKHRAAVKRERRRPEGGE